MSLNNAPLNNMGTCLPSGVGEPVRLPIATETYDIFWLDGISMKEKHDPVAPYFPVFQDFEGVEWYQSGPNYTIKKTADNGQNAIVEMIKARQERRNLNQIGANLVRDITHNFDWLVEMLVKPQSGDFFTVYGQRLELQLSPGSINYKGNDIPIPNVNGWHHILLERDAVADEVRVHINGNLVATLPGGIYFARLYFGGLYTTALHASFARMASKRVNPIDELYANAGKLLAALGESF